MDNIMEKIFGSNVPIIISGLIGIIFVLLILVSLLDKSDEKGQSNNECEKGNPDWNIDGICDGEVFELKNGAYLNCTTGWEEICRKKTISDLNCTSLITAILKNLNYCETTNRFIEVGLGCASNLISTAELVDIAINRGCIQIE